MSLIQALFIDSQARVWQWVFGLPERSFHLSELRRLTGLGSASLQRELNRLADVGLLQTERVGNLRCFKANAHSPVYPELVALTAKTLGLSAQLQKVLQPLSGRLQWVGVYGSVAKKTDKAGSDVDVMLVGDDLRLTALRWHGYRSENRFTVFQCLAHTLGWSSTQWRVLDAVHQKRNLAEYEGYLDVEETMAVELVDLTQKLIKDVRAFVDG